MIDRLMQPVIFIKNIINKGQDRSVNAKKNILASFLIKGGSIAISILSVPLTLTYVNPDEYGIWVTITSLVSWFAFFDIGFGNGLRNKFAEAKAKGEHELARIYVSTTYAILTIISVSVLLLFAVINPFLNWSVILNAPAGMAGELGILALIVFGYFCIDFVLQLIAIVLNADQRSATASFFNFLSSLLSLIIIFILTKTTKGNLVYLGVSFVGTQLIVLLAAGIWFFSNKYKIYAPSFKFVKFKYARNLMSLGLKFFLIQIAFILVYETTVIIIAQQKSTALLDYNNPVAQYNIAFKFFGVIPMAFGIIITPFWSAYTEAYVKKDFEWIRSTMKKLKSIWVLLAIGGIVMLLLSDTVYRFWVRDKIRVPFLLSLTIVSYIIANTWCTIFSVFLNGVGKLKLQLYSGLIGALINIPLAIFLGNQLGVTGVVLSSLILAIGNALWSPIQYRKIMNGTATGIWNA
jgi:O-antigen/teichoic acid export membrane protein